MTGVAVIRLLGPVRAVDPGGTILDPPSAAQRRLLAVLALDAGRTVSQDRLCDLLEVSAGALRTTVSRLRRVVGADIVSHDAHGYHLAADVDAAQFVALVAVDEPATRLERLEQALALWRGDALEEFRDEAWALADVARLEELRIYAREERANEMVARSRSGEAIADLDHIVSTHPLRDRSRGLLMLALAGDGRQAEALRAYQDYRDVLAEIGTEPSAAVQAIERQLTAAPVTGAAVLAAAPTTSMPGYGTSFVGRDDEVTEVAGRVRSERVVTIVGEAGVGKTRLAVHVANALDGELPTWWVDLATVSTATSVVDAIAIAIGSPSAQDVDAVCAAIGDRRALLLVDNCEHVRETAGQLIAEITANCPSVAVLATSRVALGIDGEHVVRLHPLDPAGAAHVLFSRRAIDAGASIDDADSALVELICRRLDGNPLAIELAAGRVGRLGLAMVGSALVSDATTPDGRFELLTGGRTVAGHRHESLRYAIDWSYSSLDDEQRAVFRCLGVFVGGFELDAVEAVQRSLGGNESAVLDVLTTLVDWNLVTARPSPNETRFGLLDTLRVFALEQLARNGELDDAVDAHAGWIAGITDAALPDWMSSEGCRRVVRLEREVDGWRAAVQHAIARHDVDLAHRLCGSASALLVWSRPDLYGMLGALDAMLQVDDPHRQTIALAKFGPTWAEHDLPGIVSCEDMLRGADASDACGMRSVVAAARQILEGAIEQAIDTRLCSLADPGIPESVHDFHLATCLYVASSRDVLGERREQWIEQVTEIATRADVPVNRLIARVALAWASDAKGDTDAAARWTDAALGAEEPMPEFHRNLAGSFISRYLMKGLPELAARRLHGMLASVGAGHAHTDSGLLATAAGILARAGHPRTDDIVASLRGRTVRAFLVGLVPDAEDRRARGTPIAPDALVAIVRAALMDVAAAPLG